MDTLAELLGAWGLGFVVVNVLADQSGLPLPSSPTLIAAAALGPAAGLEVSLVWAAAVAAALVADAGWYVAGAHTGRRVLCTLCAAARAPDACVSTTEATFARFGLPSLLIAKFVPGLSALTAALAGSTRLAPVRYFAVDLVGAALWAGTAVVLGVVFRDAVSDAIALLAQFGRYGVLGALAAAGVFGVWLVRRRWRRRV